MAPRPWPLTPDPFPLLEFQFCGELAARPWASHITSLSLVSLPEIGKGPGRVICPVRGLSWRINENRPPILATIGSQVLGHNCSLWKWSFWKQMTYSITNIFMENPFLGASHTVSHLVFQTSPLGRLYDPLLQITSPKRLVMCPSVCLSRTARQSQTQDPNPGFSHSGACHPIEDFFKAMRPF